MSIPARTRQVNRVSHKPGNNMEPTVLTLTQNPPRSFRWFGNDGHWYSPARDHKTTAINDMVNGTNIKKI